MLALEVLQAEICNLIFATAELLIVSFDFYSSVTFQSPFLHSFCDVQILVISMNHQQYMSMFNFKSVPKVSHGPIHIRFTVLFTSEKTLSTSAER